MSARMLKVSNILLWPNELMLDSQRANAKRWSTDEGLPHLMFTDRSARELLPFEGMPKKLHDLRIGRDDVYVITIPAARICEPSPDNSSASSMDVASNATFDTIEMHDTPTDEIGFIVAAPRSQEATFTSDVSATSEGILTARSRNRGPANDIEEKKSEVDSSDDLPYSSKHSHSEQARGKHG